jgi:hypothetical protein
MKDEIIARLRVSHKGKDKPNDLLQWIVDASPAKERTVKDIAERIMGLNIAAIHTTTAVGFHISRRPVLKWSGNADPKSYLLTATLAHLAAEPAKYIPALRDELETNSENGRVLQNTMTSATQLDSFLRETGRLNLISISA